MPVMPDIINKKNSTVLIIDDERKISNIISSYLKKEGFNTIIADNGETGLNELQNNPDIIILDLMLPDMDGEDICRIIRQSSDVPIIMLTAKSDEDNRVKGLLMGADDYVVKPFSPRELTARVIAHLRKSNKNQRVLSFNKGALLINKTAQEITLNNKPISLTKTEYNILLVLSQRHGAVLSRMQLMNQVQGYDSESFDRTIDAHIKNLRHKIEKNTRSPDFIKTIYAVGYKFIGIPDEN